ncbi:unnamed protein product [Rotaria sp. Silwood1]|nr:unnamed protein product [Rotaria sp. Silwood1]
MAVKILHAPESIDEINLGEQIMNYYCKTVPLVHGPSVEIFSLHAHIHLAQQVRRHGGLGHTSAFAFESCIRFIERKAHGSKHLGAQISYWIDLQTMMQNEPVKAPTLTINNEIKWLDGRLGPCQAVLIEQMAINSLEFPSFMCTENTYSKHYLNRRTNVEAEVYKLVLFPPDNSIAVVKAKQCSPAEHDGFYFVQSGRKKFMGVILEEEQNSNIQRHTASTITVSPKYSVDHANTVQPSIVNNNDDFPAVLPSTTTLGEYSTSTSHIVHKSNQKHDKRFKHKRRKQSQHGTSVMLFEPFDNTDSESNDNEDESSANSRHHVDTNQLLIDETPTFVGRQVIENNKKSKNTSAKLSSSANQQLTAFMSKLESQYLRPLLVGQERIESMAKGLFANQKKIQRVLRKQKLSRQLLSITTGFVTRYSLLSSTSPSNM